MELINWPWLEDLLVRAFDAEVRAFAEAHPEVSCFAFALEFDGLSGTFHLSYGTRPPVEAAFRQLVADNPEEPLDYRAVELHPGHWEYRAVPIQHPEGAWASAEQILAKYRANMGEGAGGNLLDDDEEEDQSEEIAEFYWLRFEFLAECVLRRLVEKDSFRFLNREPEFLAFTCNEHEYLEELEDRLQKLYPRYRRATAEWVGHPRFGLPSFLGCRGESCEAGKSALELERCTYCHRWYCPDCRPDHRHPKLAERQPFFGE